MRIGEVARAAGVSPDTIRHYERRGLLPAASRTPSGYRDFESSALRRVRIARAALSIGFTVDELGRIFQERDRGGAPCTTVRKLAGEKLMALNEYVSQLDLLRTQLRTTLREWDHSLRRTKPGQRAGLLEQFADKTPHNATRVFPHLPHLLQRRSLRD